MAGFPHYSNYIILNYIILYHIILYEIRSYCIILYFNIVLYWIILHYFITIAYFVSSLLFYFPFFWYATAFIFTFQNVSDLVLHLLLHLVFVLRCFVYLCYHYYYFFPRDLLNHNSRIKINRFILFFIFFSFLLHENTPYFKPYFIYFHQFYLIFALIFYLDFRIHHTLHNVFGTLWRSLFWPKLWLVALNLVRSKSWVVTENFVLSVFA